MNFYVLKEKKPTQEQCCYGFTFETLGQRRLRIPLGRKHQYREMHITLLRPHILRMDLEKQGGQPRGRQEIPAGDEAEQRGRLTRLGIFGFFPRRWQ